MSGITPLLDTLLHQVLGRRVDIPQPRDLNQPVLPVMPADPARQVHSDSRLDARQLPLAEQAGRSAPAPVARDNPAQGSSSRQSGAAAPAAAAPSSTVTTFSTAARLIGDLLQRFPSQPSSIAAPGVLLEEGATPPAQIASRLQQSIQGSGLFYEAHVLRWQRGDLPLEVLRREPQMQARLPVQPGGQAAASTAPVAPPLPPAAGLQVPAPASVSVSAAAAEAGATAEPGGAAPAARGEPLLLSQESTATLVRQQLELLAQPQLRWEGNIWAGVFMSLQIDAPPRTPHSAAEERDAADDPAVAEDPEWKLRMTLRLAGRGQLEAAISLRGERLALSLGSDSAALQRQLDAGCDGLRERLLACGFAQVQLQLQESAGSGRT